MQRFSGYAYRGRFDEMNASVSDAYFILAATILNSAPAFRRGFFYCDGLAPEWTFEPFPR
jgi:hypothetical protein